MRTTLTAPQRNALTILALPGASGLFVGDGFGVGSPTGSGRSIRADTLDALLKRKLVQWVQAPTPAHSHRFYITEAGRAALAAATFTNGST
jgi:hypothetical protein